MSTPNLLIESWLPIEEIGVEGKREHSTGRHPAPNRLHVWWARRPLIASRAAVLASLLPQWSPDWPETLRSKFPTEGNYNQWFIHLLGIRGDPVQGMRLVQWAKGMDIKLDFHPYGGAPRAFTVNPASEDLDLMSDLLEYTWGKRDLSVLDPFAGGGSIPFEALRFGFNTIANDLNPVAAVILKATLDYPARFGPSLANDIRKWGDIWVKRVEDQLKPYFPKQPNENIFAYLWARTVACPTTGKPVPLSPNWWLSKGSKPVAVKLVAEEWMDEPRFEILEGSKVAEIDPDEGTVSRGVGRSPWTGETISGDYIKAEAQSGHMGQILYAIVLKVKGGFKFRLPNQDDIHAVQRADQDLLKKKTRWNADDMIIYEGIPNGSKTDEPKRYGEEYWADTFTPRQLFSLTTYQETLGELRQLLTNTDMKSDKVNALITYLAIALDKAVIYNNRHCRFDPTRGIRSIFDRHDFGYVWSYAEFDSSANLLPWSISQIVNAYNEIADLIYPSQKSFLRISNKSPVENLSISQSSATSLSFIEENSIMNITVDPPYYDNVQYAELSDFFYVWLKRSIGHIFPEYFIDELTNKDDEAVANPARFKDMNRKKKILAEQDYERKMAAAFREMHRVLHPNGCLTVMFTHKRVEAWDTLATALIGSGFVIKTSWPVHTESEHSLHQAKKNAAASTILLACRKRDQTDRGEPVWWDDIQGKVRDKAREKAQEFSDRGISGVDLYISTFGPTLSIISENWPVLTSEVDPKTGQPKPLRPEIALNLAREEVIRLRRQGLLLGHDVQFDQPTDWYLMAWDAFAAEQFPYDEARKLAIVLDVDLDKTIKGSKRMLRKKGKFVILQKPVERRKKDMVDEEVDSFEHWIDAAHTAMMIYEEDGAGACDFFLRKTGLKNDTTYKALLQAMINAIPRTRIKGKFIRPEAEVLENMRLAFFDDLAAPLEEEPELPGATQLDLL